MLFFLMMKVLFAGMRTVTFHMYTCIQYIVVIRHNGDVTSKDCVVVEKLSQNENNRFY